jgi:hypothetical protein
VRRWSLRYRSTWALILAPVLVVGLSLAATTQAAAHSHGTGAIHWVKPNAVNNLDCNGWSAKYKSIDPSHRALCTDPLGPTTYKGNAPVSKYSRNGRFVDNGHYVGHDEPSIKFISNAAKSGNTFTYYMRVPADPKKPPTTNLKVTDYAELSIAPWFGLPICDPLSYPQNPCKPDSNSNASGISNPKDAGSAFMELQFYPPGVTPFQDTFSCSATKWCAAITIDSLESKFNFVGLNADCPEPINFAYLQTNGVPAGPPSPQLADNASNLPDANTLEMSAGDVVKVSVSDSAAGIKTSVDDLTTHKTGYMVASAKNGFMDTNYKTCDGRPFTFHAEFATAATQNRVPWAALEGGVLMEQEIGHGEICSSFSSHDPVDINYAEKGQTFVDNKVYDTCDGGPEGPHAKGEGPCNTTTGVCTNPTTEGKTGPVACPSDNYTSADLCEFADGYCFPKGARTVVINGKDVKETSIINICFNNRFQNGDLDYDGTSYQTGTWPDGSPNHPQSIRYVGPFQADGQPYPLAQFETDGPQSEILCDVHTGSGCTLPPRGGADFYPYWTLTSKQALKPGMFPKGACVWNFGSTISHITTNTFGADKEYGVRDPKWYGGTFITPKPVPNPEVTKGCPKLGSTG